MGIQKICGKVPKDNTSVQVLKSLKHHKIQNARTEEMARS